jgi:hypothetical protein
MVCGGLRRGDKELWEWWFWAFHVERRKGEGGRFHSSCSLLLTMGKERRSGNNGKMNRRKGVVE